MAGFDALLDSNVIIAAMADEHPHNPASAAIFCSGRQRFAVAAHSLAEAYSTLTRRSANAPFRWPPADAWAGLSSMVAATTLLGLSPAQTLDTIRGYAEAGGIGARLYDRLIGQVAVQYGIPRIITWNVGHMRDLFPGLDVVDPLAAATA